MREQNQIVTSSSDATEEKDERRSEDKNRFRNHQQHMEDKKNNTEQTHTGAAHARPSQQQETQGDEGHRRGTGRHRREAQRAREAQGKVRTCGGGCRLSKQQHSDRKGQTVRYGNATTQHMVMAKRRTRTESEITSSTWRTRTTQSKHTQAHARPSQQQEITDTEAGEGKRT